MIDKCKWFGHKWRPVFISGEYSGVKIRFIACYCMRCKIGDEAIIDTLHKMTKRNYGTYSQEYFNEDNNEY